jgi:DNA polymerase eta
LNIVLDYASNDEFYFDLSKEVNKSILNGVDISKAIRAIRGQSTPQKIALESTRQKQGIEQILYRIGQVHPKSNEIRRYEDELRLLHGAVLMSKIVAVIQEVTGFTCSAGISHNMLLAKLACNLNKPNGITMLPLAGISRTSKRVTVDGIPGLGGSGPNSFGSKLRGLGIYNMWQLQQASMRHLNKVFKAENCHRLIAWAHGMCDDVVQERNVKLTLSCGKESANCRDPDSLFFWFGGERLGGELWERLEEERVHNHRRPTRISIMVAGKTIGTVTWSDGEKSQEMLLGLIREELEVAEFSYPVRGAIKLLVPEFVPVN